MRIKFLDITKGVLIVLVVIGHLPTPFREMIYYFHMPVFFIISGLFIPVNQGLREKYILKKIKTLMVPYGMFLLFFGLFFYQSDAQHFIQLFLGGRFLVGPLSPFWFITALFFGFLYFFLIEKFFPLKYRIPAILFLYLLGYVESIFFEHFKLLFYIPLAIDVSLLTLVYLFMGRSLKPFIVQLEESKKLPLLLLFSSVIGLGIFFMLQHYQIISYRMDMKNAVYPNLIGNIFVPLTFMGFIISLSKLLERPLLFLRHFGEASLVIMYFHMPIIYLLKGQLPIWLLFILACSLPVLLHYLFGKFLWTQRLLLGRWK